MCRKGQQVEACAGHACHCAERRYYSPGRVSRRRITHQSPNQILQLIHIFQCLIQGTLTDLRASRLASVDLSSGATWTCTLSSNVTLRPVFGVTNALPSSSSPSESSPALKRVVEWGAGSSESLLDRRGSLCSWAVPACRGREEFLNIIYEQNMGGWKMRRIGASASFAKLCLMQRRRQKIGTNP